MSYERRRCERGITLVEVLMAVAIFAVVVGVTASSLVSFYVTMDVQEQRIEAVQSCRAVLGALREQRAKYTLPNDGYDWAAFHTWIQTQENSHWQNFLRTGRDHEELREHNITVQCLSMAGGPAGPNDNPIEVHVISTWRDRKNRPMQAQVVSVLTNQ